MNFDNVSLWFGKDEENNIVTISEVDKSNNKQYYCPICGSEIIARQGEINSWCFAHIDKSLCTMESMVHFWFKNKLIVEGTKFIINSDKAREYVCKDILVEETYDVGDKKYRPDITVITESGETIYFEIKYSNKKKLEDYINIWNSLGNIVVEVDSKSMMASNNKTLPTFDALYYNGKCYHINDLEDDIYYNTIGKRKHILRNYLTESSRNELGKLDWLWKEIKKYKTGDVNIEDISLLIRQIDEKDGRDVVISILRKSFCNNIVKDYVEFYKLKINKSLEPIDFNCNGALIHYSIKVPHFIYDRVYNTGFTIEFYTSKNILIGYTIISDINNIKIDRDDIINRFDLGLIIFDDAKSYVNTQFDFSKLVNNLDSYTYPRLVYSYSEYYDSHRLNINDFPNKYNGDHIKLGEYETKEEIIDHVMSKININDMFTKEEVVEINNLSVKLKGKFSNNTYDVKVCLYSGCRISVSIGDLKNNKYGTTYYGILDLQKKEICNLDDVYKSSCEQINNTTNELNYKNDVNNIVDMLNEKYEKVRGHWRFSKNNKTSTFIRIENDVEYGEIGDECLTSYADGKITLKELEIKILLLSSNYVRNYIYRKMNKEVVK